MCHGHGAFAWHIHRFKGTLSIKINKKLSTIEISIGRHKSQRKRTRVRHKNKNVSDKEF